MSAVHDIARGTKALGRFNILRKFKAEISKQVSKVYTSYACFHCPLRVDLGRRGHAAAFSEKMNK